MLRTRVVRAAAILIALGLPAAPFVASAQNAPSPETIQAANELMAVMSKDTVQQLVTGLTGQIWPSMEQAIRGKRADIDQTMLSELRSEFERIQMQYMGGVMADAPAIYARHFTAQELRDMLAFYRTPTGQKSLQVMPQLMAEVFGTIMPRMQALQAQIMDAFQKILRQRGIDL